MFERILVPTDGSVFDVRPLSGPLASDFSGAFGPAPVGDYVARMSNCPVLLYC